MDKRKIEYTKTCAICNLEYTHKGHITNGKCKECNRIENLAKGRKKVRDEMEDTIATSQFIFQEHNAEQWVECKLCGLRANQIHSHLRTFHEVDAVEYKKQYGPTVSKEGSERVKGANNPAYQHGGKFSPFSEKFVKYKNMNISERDMIIANTKQQVKDSILEHPENRNTNPEYWIKTEGVTYDEAVKMVSERQSTFSLDICIEKFGEDAGLEIWQARQNKWQDNLTSKPTDEIAEINRKKSTKVNFSSLWRNELDMPGIFYIITLPNKNIKIGVTTRTLVQRYGSALHGCTISFIKESNISDCFKIEQIIKRVLASYRIHREEQFDVYGWTETMKNISAEEILKEVNSIEENGIENEFGKMFTKYQPKICITDTSQ